MEIRPTDHRVYRPRGGVAKKEEFESYSSLSKYLECPVAYYKHYKAYGREPVIPAVLAGRVIHETIANVMVEKMFRNTLVNDADLYEIFLTCWGAEMKNAKDDRLNSLRWTDTDPTPTELRQRIFKLLQSWMVTTAPTLEPRAVEEPFAIHLSGVKQFLFGRLDLVTKDGLLIDHKTSGRRLEEVMRRDYQLQLGIYTLGYWELFKSWPVGTQLHFFITGGEPEFHLDPDYNLSRAEVQDMLDNTIKPAMLGITAAKERGIWSCLCGHHQEVTVASSATTNVHGPNTTAKV